MTNTMPTNTEKLTLFYDGYCPLCLKEMKQLKRLDKHERLQLIDIQHSEFEQRYPELNKDDLNSRLHAYLESNDKSRELLLGLDVTYHAWRLVGRGWMIKPLRWPIIRIVSDWVYLWFARNRYRISYWLTGQSRCYECKWDPNDK